MTKTEIANIALAKFREGRITNIESTTDPVAVVMNDQYDHALELVLEEHRWNFAGKRVTLTQLSDDPPFGWDHQYQLPSDIIRLKDVNGEDVEASSRLFAIEGTALLTNDDTVTITYVAKVTDTNLFSPSFVEALCFKLASITCARLTGDSELAIMLDKQYNYALSKAVHNDTKAAGSRDRNLMQRLMDSAPILGGSYRYPSSGSAGGGTSSTSGSVPAHKHGLTDLLQSSATDGQTIVWNATEERWEAGDAGGASPLTTKGDIFAYDTDDARLPVGTDGQFLKADSTQPTGLKWETASGTGDLLASNNLSELTPTASTARSNLGLGTAATSNTGDFATASHTHATTDITSGTMADARIAQSNVTQHEAALTITPTQIDSTGSADETILTSDGLGNATFDTLASQTTIKDIQETGSNTGLVDGGVLSIGTGGAGVATTFSISDGHGYVLDLSTPSSPVCTKVSWTGKTDIAVTNINSQLITFVCINSAGTVLQSGSRWIPEDYRDCIILGVVVHVNKSTVDAVNQEQWPATYSGANLADLFEVLKFVNFGGNLLSGNPNGSLNLQKSAGTLFGRGVNYSNSKTKPNHLTMAATGTGAGDLSQFQYRLSDGTYGTGGDAPYASLTNQSIHPTRYESSAGVLSTVAQNKFTAQRIFLFTSGNIKVQYGIAEYANFEEAKAALSTEAFVLEPSIEANGLFLGYLIVQESCTDLTDPADALFIQANKFGDAPAGGGAGGASDHGLLVGLLDDDHTQYSLISSQAGAPTSTPTRVGEINIDTTNDNAYVSVDTTLPSDWVQIDGAGGGGISDGDTLTTGLTFPNTGLHILDTGGDHDLILKTNGNQLADRTLSIELSNGDRTLTLNGNTTLSGTNTGDEATATTTTEGIAEVATAAEIDSADPTARMVTPFYLSQSRYNNYLPRVLTTTAKTTGFTAVIGETHYIDTSAGGFTATLPAIASGQGRIAFYFTGTGNSLIVDPNAAETINGKSSIKLDHGHNTIENDGSEWKLVQRSGISPNRLDPAQITANQDGYNPTDWSHGVTHLYIDSDASREIQGFEENGFHDMEQVIVTNDGSNDIIIKHDTSTTVANRVLVDGGADFTLGANQTGILMRDGTVNKWRFYGISSGGGGGSVANDTLWDAAGDLAIGTGVDAATRLAIGTNGQVLTSNGTTAVWAAAGAADNLGNHTATQDLNMAGFNVDSADSIYLDEKAAADVDVVGDGQLWVKDSAPNRLMFTDDTGQDFELLETYMGFACSDETTALTTGQKIATDMPFDFTVTRVYASLVTAGTTTAITVDVEDEGVSILNAVLSISAGSNNAETSTFASAATEYALTKGDLLTVDVDSVDSGATGAGLKIYLVGYRT